MLGLSKTVIKTDNSFLRNYWRIMFQFDNILIPNSIHRSIRIFLIQFNEAGKVQCFDIHRKENDKTVVRLQILQETRLVPVSDLIVEVITRRKLCDRKFFLGIEFMYLVNEILSLEIKLWVLTIPGPSWSAVLASSKQPLYDRG